MKREKLIRMTAHSQTLGLLKGQLAFLQQYMDVVLVAKNTGNLRTLAEGEGVETAIAMNRNHDDGTPVDVYTGENVSNIVAKIIQSYVPVVNKMVWRKE